MKKNDCYNFIQDTYQNWAENSFAPYGLGGPMWDAPLAGFAAGDDPLWDKLKEVADPCHWTPEELWATARPGEAVSAGELTVLVLAFPHPEATVLEQQAAADTPVPRWVYSRNSWGKVIAPFRDGLLSRLQAAGVDALAPDALPQFGTVRAEDGALRARWSHRHAAFAAGLGTFGLSDGFITRRGMAVRFLTLVLRAVLPADPRPTQDPYGWCLYHQRGVCGACIVRCPSLAIGVEGHDKVLCEAYLEGCRGRCRDLPGLDPNQEAGCGICQAGVPCALRNPMEE